MKKLSILILCLVACVVTSCKKDEAASYNYTNAIPKDASMVVGINVNSMVDKSGLYENSTVINQVLVMAKMMTSDETYKTLEGLTKDLSNSGIDCSEPIYVASAGENFMSSLMTAKLKSKSTFESLLGTLKSNGLPVEIQSGEGYSYVAFPGGMTMAYNDSALVVGLGTEVGAMLSRSEGESLASTEAFKKFEAEGVDINMMMNMGALMEMGQAQMGAAVMQQVEESMKATGVENYDGVYSYCGVDFVKGAIAIYASMYSENEQLNAYQSEMMGAVKPLSGRFNKYSDSSAYGMLSYGFNGPKFGSYLKTALMSMKYMFDFESADLDMMENLISFVDGDMTVVYTHSEDINVYADAASEAKAQEVVADITERLGEGAAELNLRVAGDVVSASSDIFEADRATTAKSPSINDIDFMLDPNDKMFMFGFASEEWIFDLVRPHMMHSYTALGAIKMFDRVEFGADTDCRAELYLTLDNKDDNALKSIADYVISNFM